MRPVQTRMKIVSKISHGTITQVSTDGKSGLITSMGRNGKLERLPFTYGNGRFVTIGSKGPQFSGPTKIEAGQTKHLRALRKGKAVVFETRGEGPERKVGPWTYEVLWPRTVRQTQEAPPPPNGPNLPPVVVRPKTPGPPPFRVEIIDNKSKRPKPSGRNPRRRSDRGIPSIDFS